MNHPTHWLAGRQPDWHHLNPVSNRIVPAPSASGPARSLILRLPINSSMSVVPGTSGDSDVWMPRTADRSMMRLLLPWFCCRLYCASTAPLRLPSPLRTNQRFCVLPAWHRAAGTLEQVALVDDRHVAAGSVRFCCDECSEWKNWREGSAPFSRLLGAGLPLEGAAGWLLTKKRPNVRSSVKSRCACRQTSELQQVPATRQ